SRAREGIIEPSAGLTVLLHGRLRTEVGLENGHQPVDALPVADPAEHDVLVEGPPLRAASCVRTLEVEGVADGASGHLRGLVLVAGGGGRLLGDESHG
ncbi:unnamed protein product, partial [Musa acuminata subsp. malaccensis]